MTWSTATLGEVAQRDGGLIQTGPFGSQLHQSDYVADGIPVIMPKDITEGRVDSISVARVSEATANRLSRHQLRPRTIVLPRRGEITKRAFVRDDQTGWLCGTGCLQIALEGKHLLPEFLYYYMEQESIARWLEQHAVGTTMLNLSAGIVTELPLKYPVLAVQQRIADILSAYDDLIENNRRRIALLEDAARQLYREWFVRLRFPGHEHTRITNGVPEGWAGGRVSEFGKVVTGKTPSTKEPDNYGGQIPFIKTPDMHGNVFVVATESSITEKGANTQPLKFIPPNTLLVSCIGTIGVVSITSTLAQFNQQINAVVPTEEACRYYLFFAFKDLKETMKAIGGGATMGNVNKTKFEGLKVRKPRMSLLREFHEFCTPAFQQIHLLSLQTLKLRAARDLLLPRLMTGKIAV